MSACRNILSRASCPALRRAKSKKAFPHGGRCPRPRPRAMRATFRHSPFTGNCRGLLIRPRQGQPSRRGRQKLKKSSFFCQNPLAKRAAQCYNTKALVPPSHRRDNDTSLYRRSSDEQSCMNVAIKWRNSNHGRNEAFYRGYDQREQAPVRSRRHRSRLRPHQGRRQGAYPGF